MPAAIRSVRCITRAAKKCRIVIAVLVILQVICLFAFHLSKSDGSILKEASPTLAASLTKFKSYTPNLGHLMEAFVLTDPAQVQGLKNEGHLRLSPSHYASLYSDSPPITCSQENCPIWREPSSLLPEWMKKYFDWHSQVRPILNQTNWNSYRYVVMTCTKGSRCGGTSDRLKPVPLILWYAYTNKRIIMIHWSRPCKLEEFLLPPAGGLDWRVPDYMNKLVTQPGAGLRRMRRELADPNCIVVRTKLQSYNGGSLLYNEQVEGPSFEDIYHDVWRTMFTPSPPVARIIERTMKELNLEAGNYAAIHLRALYDRKDRPNQEIEKMAKNALACASHLRPGGPFYFASDSEHATKFLIQWAKNNTNVRLEAVIRHYEPVHLEFAENWETRPVSDFYETFTDLYLLGMSRCVAYGVGGYGHWGLMIGYNSSCFSVHNKRSAPHCDMYQGAIPNHVHFEIKGPIFRYPIDSDGQKIRYTTPDHESKEVRETSFIESGVHGNQKQDSIRSESQSLTLVSASTYIWSKSDSIPLWMKEYFSWHSEVRKDLTEENMGSHRFLIMQCLDTDNSCGGLSDRLKPLPLMLLLAQKSNRLLFIWWKRPAPLQEFLLPPAGGLDWRLPTFLEQHVISIGSPPYLKPMLMKAVYKDKSIVQALFQSPTGGESVFNELIPNTTQHFAELYHDMFRFLFEPSPPVAEMINAMMDQMKIKPGEYVGAHLRAVYARLDRPYDESRFLGINAIHCASQLRPGGPVYFASDTNDAIKAVQEYAHNNSFNVISLSHNSEPLHLDKASNWTTRKPSEYYPTFVDLYLLGQSRCMSYSNGGFGTMALYMGFNSSCGLRYLKGHKNKICPDWISHE